MPQPTPEEEKAMLATLASLQHEPPIQLEVSAMMAYFLVANLQLALRAPMNTGPTAKAVKVFTKELEERIAPIGSDLHNIMEMGWSTEFDAKDEMGGKCSTVSALHRSDRKGGA